jgi:5,10-methylenetetrahydromethanopterin reductase
VHEIPLHLSAFGPKGRALGARLGAGWAFFSGSTGPAVSALTDMQASWRAAGRDDALYANVFTLGCVLKDGERADSPRAIAQGGTLAATFMHDMVERRAWGEDVAAPPFLAEALDEYARLYQTYEPADARWLQLHTGHLMYVRDDERRFLTEPVMQAMTFTGTAADLRGRVEALRDAGYAQFTIQIVEGQEHALEDWAKVLKPLGLGGTGAQA